jgi:2-polyprenyl-3-methyl-5-hydroxy-6-metoxy-1,4-benzoquinol methylase
MAPVHDGPAASLTAAAPHPGHCSACETPFGQPEALRLWDGSLLRCDRCSTWTCFPRPSVRAQAARHDTPEYFEHPYFQVRREDRQFFLGRCHEVFAFLATELDGRSLAGSRLLDIGCDTGEFLSAAAECHGVVPAGVDVASRAVQRARSRGLPVWQGMVEDAPNEMSGFDLITAVDVIEHTPDPHALLASAWRRLVPGGLMYVQTPNFGSTVYAAGRSLCRMTGGRPRRMLERLLPPEHVQYFSRSGLRLLAERSGFRVAKLQTRILPARDIATAACVRGGVMALQAVDRWRGEEILICAVLRRPLEG